MAKNKDKNENPFVPIDEQPYEVPENWCWTRLINISEIITGSTPSKKHQEYYGGRFPFFKPADLDAEMEMYDATEYLSEEGKSVSRIIPRLSTAVCCIGTIGKSGMLQVDGSTNQQINAIIPKINPYYVYYYTKTDWFIRELWLKSTSTTISMVNKSNMETNLIPIPPTNEQQRIVDRIESLFAKLDEAKEKAQAVVDGFELRKSAILHKAITGELTAEWREEHGISFDTWKQDTLENYVSCQYGYTEKASNEKIGPRFLRITDIQNGNVNWNEVPYCQINSADYAKYVISKEDILVARTGATTGKSYIVTDDVDAVFASYLIRITISNVELLNAYYLYHFLQSSLYWIQIMELSQGIALPGVNGSKLKTLKIPVPSIQEQVEIVRILDIILQKEQQAKDAAETVISQIDIMKKSILAGAFRGELGTNNPAEASPAELLQGIQH